MGSAVGGIVGGVGSIIGGAMGSDAADSAANSQLAAAQQANETQKWMYEQNRNNLTPYNQFGTAGMNMLAYYLGLANTPTGGVGGSSYDQIRQELLPSYSSSGNPPSLASMGLSGRDATWGYDPYQQKWGYQVKGSTGGDADMPTTYWKYADGYSGSGAVDEAGLERAIQARLTQQQSATSAASTDPRFGSLLQNYREYTPFSMADFEADPGYAFRQSEGQKAIERSAAARGGLNSGRALKDLDAYSQGLASQEYQNAYGRYNNDYMTGYNTFNQNQNNIYNRLMGVTGVGASAANALAGVGSNYANQIANTQLSAGNAAAAGQIGSANAWSNALGGVTNSLSDYLARNTSTQGQSGYTVSPTFSMGGSAINGWPT